MFYDANDHLCARFLMKKTMSEFARVVLKGVSNASQKAVFSHNGVARNGWVGNSPIAYRDGRS
jgi:hypothetical protein